MADNSIKIDLTIDGAQESIRTVNTLQDSLSDMAKIAQSASGLMISLGAAMATATAAGVSLSTVLAGPAGIGLALGAAAIALQLLPQPLDETSKKIEEITKRIEDYSQAIKNFEFSSLEDSLETNKKFNDDLDQLISIKIKELDSAKKILSSLTENTDQLNGTTFINTKAYKDLEEEINKTSNALQKLQKEKINSNNSLDVQTNKLAALADKMKGGAISITQLKEETKDLSNNELRALTGTLNSNLNALGRSSEAFRTLNQNLSNLRNIIQPDPYAEKLKQEAFLKQQEFNAKIKASNETYQKDLAQIEKNGALASSSLTLTHLEEKKKLYEEYGKSVVKINKDIQQAESELTKNAVKEFGSIKAAPLETQSVKLEKPSSMKPVEFGDPQAYAQDWQKSWADRERDELDLAEAAELKKADVYANAEEMKTAIHEKYSKHRRSIDEEEALAQAQIYLGALNFIGGAIGEHTAAGKAISIANATMSTYEAAAKALTAGPIIGEILAGMVVAAGLANVAKIAAVEPPKMPGYARGGVVIGEQGPEIIAPMQDYASGQALLVQQTVMEARRAMSSDQYTQASGDNQTLIQELQKLNASFEGYSSRPITITKDAVGKIVSQGNSQLRKSRV